ncbi:MAG: hypothetical protein L0H93_09325, partial [Nocardioides sp.]|nr:hypothetical protein [Nocardioides sp.]
QARLRDELTEILEWPETEDTDVLDLAGHDVSYLRISHQAAGHSLVTELWTWVLGDEEWTVTGTVSLEAYPTFCDVFESIADAFSPEEVSQRRRAG